MACTCLGEDVEEDPQWFKDHVAENSELEDEHGDLFDDTDLVEPLDPSQMIVGTEFPDKKAFQRHLKHFCVLSECEYKTENSEKSRVRVWCAKRFNRRGRVVCHWMVFASKLQHQSTFKVKGVNLKHTCKGVVQDKVKNRSADS